MTDFDKVTRYDCGVDNETFGGHNPIPRMKADAKGSWVRDRDYQALLEAYKEIKWMYEELCK